MNKNNKMKDKKKKRASQETKIYQKQTSRANSKIPQINDLLIFEIHFYKLNININK